MSEIMEKEKDECFECGKVIVEMDSKQFVNGEIYCDTCYDDIFFLCSCCNEEEKLDDSYSSENGTICNYCYNNNYYRCSYCDALYHNDDSCDCNNDDISNFEKGYSTSDKYTIKSERDYSCEIECYYPDRSTLNRVVDSIPSEIGMTSDGSLNENGIEFQTPRLSGVRGEKMLESFCKTLSDNRFRTDSACGLHIHLDGEDILGTKNAIQKMMIFFMVYEDVIMSFLPESRRENTYCLPISDFYHLREIKECYCVDDFEKIWYRQEDKDRRDDYKRDRHHNTRYAGINFHSLLSGGHLEIRYHNGTINFQKIINWIKLFTLIMDSVKKSCPQKDYTSKLSLTSLLKVKFILGLPEKTLSFFNMIDLPKEQRDYFLERQKKFTAKPESNEKTPCAE